MKPRLSMGATLPALALAIAAALPAKASEFTPLDRHGRATYLITFEEAGLLETHRQRSAPGTRFNIDAVAAERQQLLTSQQSHLNNMRSRLGRADIAPTHEYLVTHSGVAVRLSDDEVAKLRSLRGIKNIERERQYSLDTYRGPQFIGANEIWDGSSVPGGAEIDGRGMVAAILDTGIVQNHPSFANDASCGHGTGSIPNKLISALDCSSTTNGVCSGANPGDTNSHGSHTAATVAGNRLDNTANPAPAMEISGVAPCASIRSYKVCATNQCANADITAGLNSVLTHGDADVVNFSISGGLNPWSDADRRFLDMVDQGVFVAASAGNNSVTDPAVVGRVNHRGPWVTTVAASTRDGDFAGRLTVNGQDYDAAHGALSPAGTSVTGMPIRFDPNQPAGAEGCNASPFPANFFDGAIALINRGDCTFTEKVNNAVAAGAVKVIIWNNAAGGLAPVTPGADPNTPVYGITQAAGQAIRAYITANPGAAVADLEVIPSASDLLADFSYRGPTPSPLADLQKPDITAPGVNIYAAAATSSGGPDYTRMSGTSMSSPHVAGAGLLVAQVQPSWTPSEIKSALQMTAHKAGTKENGTTPWDWDDVGHGRALVNKAVNAGFVLNETMANYLAANPTLNNDFSVRELNLAAVRNLNCTPSCTWTRTVRNTLGQSATWTATGNSLVAGSEVRITVEPATFTFSGDTTETQELTITVEPVDNLASRVGFGEIVFTESGNRSPDLHFTVAISGVPAVPNTPRIEVDSTSLTYVMNAGQTEDQTFNISNTGLQPLTWTTGEAAANRGAGLRFDPTQDEVLTIPNFTVTPSEPANFDIPGGVTSTTNVIGFTFTGTVTQLTGWDYASDLRLLMTSPDNQTFDVGGFGGTVVNPWDFDGSGSGSVGTYTSTHMSAFNDAQSVGDWNFSFRHGYSGGDPMSWEDVTITLHKLAIPSNCVNPEDIPWLSVSPASGSTAPGESSEVTVTVDTSGLQDGEYSALVCVNSNDPARPVLDVPVSLTVMTGNINPATIVVSEDSYSFALVGGAAGGIDTVTMTISNTGHLPLSWTIEEAMARGPRGDGVQSTSRPVGRQPVLAMSDGSVQVYAEDLVVDSSRGANGPTLSVDGATTDGVMGNPNAVANTKRVLPIGVGNKVIGVGWSVTIATEGESWLRESRLGILSAADASTWLGITPVNMTSSGTEHGVQPVVMLADNNIAPIEADAAGMLYLEWYETYDDGISPESTWYDYTGGGLPGGVRLICEDQDACDAAVSGNTPLPPQCDTPSDVPWLSVEPVAGLTTGGNSADVTISVNATGMAAGTHEALLCVRSNAANEQLIEIPVTLEVSAPATISVSPESISETLVTGNSRTVNIGITNQGDADLEWEIEEGQPLRRQQPVAVAPASRTEIAGAVSFLREGGLVHGGNVAAVRGSFDCDTAPGLVILEDGTVDDGYTFNPTNGITQARFAQAYELDAPSLPGTVCVAFLSMGPSSVTFDVVVYAADGANGAPGTELGSVTATATGISSGLIAAPQWHSVDLSSLNLVLPAGRVYIGVRYTPTNPNVFLGVDDNADTAQAVGYASNNISPDWALITDTPNWADYRALFIRPQFNLAGACDNPGDVPWLSVNPASGTTASGVTDTVAVTMDASGMAAGTYEAMLCISSNDPARPLVQVPVTMEVELDTNSSLVEGTVRGLGYCSADPSVLAGATVQVIGTNGVYTTTTNASGQYSVTLSSAEGPVTIAATAANHQVGTEVKLSLVAGGSVTADFDLVLNAPCATATPDALGITLAPDSAGMEELLLNNTGARFYNWSLDIEATRSSAFPRGTEDVVRDGSFEAGSPNNPYWDEFSQAYTTVLCDTNCSTTGTSSARTGNWWVWFGGRAAGDTGYVSQTVTIPAGGHAEVRFFLRIPNSIQPGYLRVSMDGQQLLEITNEQADDYTAAYREVVINVTQFADGGSHVLRFDSVTQSSTNVTNFFVDDVSLVVQPGALDCADPQGVDWLVTSEDSGTVAGGTSETVDVMYDSTGLAVGQYQANLCVTTSDNNNALIVIPVTLTVEEQDDEIFEDGFEAEDTSPRPVGEDSRRQ